MRHILFVAVLALCGCASWFHAKIPPASVTAAPEQAALLWSAAHAELQARGFPISSVDPGRGTIATAFVVMPGRVPCGYLKCAYRDRIGITVAPRGEVEVRISRELSSIWVAATPSALIGGTSWEPPASTQRATVAGVVADQDALLRAIVQRANMTSPWPPPTAADPSTPRP